MLEKSFYQREDPVQIAHDLIGKVLVTHFNEELTKGIIVETEAYKAPEDRACHAHLNKFSKRTEVMFREGGCAYIYLCYGMHHLFNVVTGKEGQAHAVLVRALEPLEGKDFMEERRGNPKDKYRVTKGPGSLSKAMGITKELTGHMLTQEDSEIWIEEPVQNKKYDIQTSARIGIDYAKEWKDVPWRFYVRGNKYVSG